MIEIVTFPAPVVVKYFFVEGTNLPKLYGRSLDPQDLSGYTVAIRIQHPNDSAVEVAGAVTNGPNGNFEIPATPGWPENTLVNGILPAQISLTDPTSLVTKFHTVELHVERKI